MTKILREKIMFCSVPSVNTILKNSEAKTLIWRTFNETSRSPKNHLKSLNRPEEEGSNAELLMWDFTIFIRSALYSCALRSAALHRDRRHRHAVPTPAPQARQQRPARTRFQTQSLRGVTAAPKPHLVPQRLLRGRSPAHRQRGGASGGAAEITRGNRGLWQEERRSGKESKIKHRKERSLRKVEEDKETEMKQNKSIQHKDERRGWDSRAARIV